MSTEPLASAQSEGTSVPAAQLGYIDYDCEVTVVGDEVLVEFRRGGQSWSHNPPPIPWGSRARFEFRLKTDGYQFANLDPHHRNHIIGPFKLDCDESAPDSQKDAEIRFPPILNVEIKRDQQSAWMTLTNRYHHSEKHKYSLHVSVEPTHGGKTLTSEDPTLIEEPYEPPGDGERPGGE